MPPLRTPLLSLLPLHREMIEARLRQESFTLRVDGLPELQFPPEWPGDPLPAFPFMLADLHTPEVWGSFVLVEAQSGQVIGLMGTKGTPDVQGRVEVGYGLIPAARGRGYATEAVGEMLRWLLSQPQVQQVAAETSVTNRASERVLQKLGFRCTGSSWSEDDGDLHTWARRL